MKITAKGRYALRLLLDVALHQQQGSVTLSDIAARQGISQPYLWHVVTPLTAAGILRVKRGSQGGYVLARKPSEISIRDIVNVLEGSVTFVADQKVDEENRNSVYMVTHNAWVELENKIAEVLGGITLAELLARHRDAEDIDNLNYTI
jgi:Rrf2 family transcriptional regulator, cysteine metabolism repressor